MSRISVLSALAALVAAGCSSAIRPGDISPRLDQVAWQERQQRVEPQSKSQTELQDLRAAYADAAAEAPDGAAGLELLYDRALQSNAELRAVHFQRLMADADARNAIVRYFPRIVGVSDISRKFQNIITSDNEVFSAGRSNYRERTSRLEANQPVFDGELLHQYRAADARAHQAYLAYISSIQRIGLQVAIEYLKALEAAALLADARERLTLLDRHLGHLGERVRADSATAETLELIRLDRDATEAELHRAMLDRRTALARLGELTGAPVTGVAGLPQSVKMSTPSLAELQTLARDSNLELIARRFEIEANREDVTQATMAAFGPRIYAFGTTELEDQGGSRFGGGSKTHDTTVGLRATIPIFNADGKGYAARREELKYQRSMHDFVAFERELMRRVEETYHRMRSSQSRGSLYARMVSSNRSIINAVNVRVTAGRSPLTEELVHRIALSEQTKNSRIETYARLRAWFELRTLTGLLRDSDFSTAAASRPG